MKRITTIVHFSVPDDHLDDFLPMWHQTQKLMLAQPGALDGILHRCIDQGAPFQFINVAHWASPEMLANALGTTTEENREAGIDVNALLHSWGVTVSQNNYTEELEY